MATHAYTRSNPMLLKVVHPTTTAVGGVSATVDVKEFREILWLLDVTAISGTSAELNVYLDTSPDGTTWWQVERLGPGNIAALPGNPRPDTYALSMGGMVDGTIVGMKMRVRWTLAGTGPSVTFSVQAICQ